MVFILLMKYLRLISIIGSVNSSVQAVNQQLNIWCICVWALASFFSNLGVVNNCSGFSGFWNGWNYVKLGINSSVASHTFLTSSFNNVFFVSGNFNNVLLLSGNLVWDLLVLAAISTILWSESNIIILLNFFSILMLLSFKLFVCGVIEFTIVIIMVYQSAIIILFLVNSLHLSNMSFLWIISYLNFLGLISVIVNRLLCLFYEIVILLYYVNVYVIDLGSFIVFVSSLVVGVVGNGLVYVATSFIVFYSNCESELLCCFYFWYFGFCFGFCFFWILLDNGFIYVLFVMLDCVYVYFGLLNRNDISYNDIMSRYSLTNSLYGIDVISQRKLSHFKNDSSVNVFGFYSIPNSNYIRVFFQVHDPLSDFSDLMDDYNIGDSDLYYATFHWAKMRWDFMKLEA